jgi:hypothetical protein
VETCSTHGRDKFKKRLVERTTRDESKVELGYNVMKGTE